jgi:transcriptional regulator
MLIHPWDAGTDEEWRTWLTDHQFGQLIAVDADARPIIVPTPFLLAEDRILLHLARPNPIWPALEQRGEAVLSVIDDYAHIPGTWRPRDNVPPSAGVPTEYYAAVQVRGPVDLVDEPAAKADLLRRQLAGFGMADDHDDVPPDHRLLNGIRGIVPHIREVAAKFKYDDNRGGVTQRAVAANLADRNQNRDQGARAQQLRRASVDRGPASTAR